MPRLLCCLYCLPTIRSGVVNLAISHRLIRGEMPPFFLSFPTAKRSLKPFLLSRSLIKSFVAPLRQKTTAQKGLRRKNSNKFGALSHVHYLLRGKFMWPRCVTRMLRREARRAVKTTSGVEWSGRGFSCSTTFMRRLSKRGGMCHKGEEKIRLQPLGTHFYPPLQVVHRTFCPSPRLTCHSSRTLSLKRAKVLL